MSVLIACKKDNVVYMGTDTRVIVNEHKKSELCESNYKIQKLENGMLLGVISERITRQVIFAYSEIFTLDKKGRLTRKHIIEEIIPSLFKVLHKNELMVKEEGDVPSMSAQIILAHEDTLYEIYKDFTVYRYEDFQILGSSVSYGQFIISNIKETDDVNNSIVKALEMISKYNQLVGRPYLLIDTKDKEYKLIRGEDE